MSSRFLVGLSAWVLGAVTATAGSMIAVNQLAHGLLQSQGQQLSGTTVSADYDHDTHSADPSATPSASATKRHAGPAAKVTPATVPSRTVAPSQGPAPSPTAQPSKTPDPSSTGTLLVSADGSVMATCQSAGAYLLYWSPDQGFVADDVNRGPAATASVTFDGPGGLVMRVVCSGGTPIAHVSTDE